MAERDEKSETTVSPAMLLSYKKEAGMEASPEWLFNVIKNAEWKIQNDAKPQGPNQRRNVSLSYTPVSPERL